MPDRTQRPTGRPADRIYRLAALLAFVAVVFPAGSHGRTGREVFRFDKQSLAFSEVSGYDVVRYAGIDLSCDVGKPQVPVKLVHVPVPAGMEITGVRIVRVEDETLAGEYRLFPVQPPQALSQPVSPFVAGNVSVYSSADAYPRDIVSVVSQGFAAGFNVGALVVYPVQYVPSERKLVFHSLIEIEITYAASARRPLRFRPNAYAEAMHRRSLGRILEHSEGLTRWYDVGPQAASDLPDEEHLYVIVTNDALAPAFQDLSDWKTQKGLSGEIVTTSWIASTYSGVDLGERIRNFITDAYQNWGTVWVLLGGDTAIIPARMTYAMDSGYGTNNNRIPCDLYYADLDGDWNANGNGVYGEVADDIDMYPEVFIGRASVEDTTEARNWARKVEIYEKRWMRPAGNEHELDMLFLAEVLWTDPYTNSGEGKDYIDETYVPDRFDPITKLYEALGNESYAAVMSALNSGQNIINHSGHASYAVMGIGATYLQTGDMDDLTNRYRPSILYSIGCWPAAFDADCIAEHFLTNRYGGGAAFIGNSRYGWGSPGNPLFGYSDRFDQRFFKALFADGVVHLGQALAAAKTVYVPFAQQENVYRWCEFEINLLGDPEMPVWTDAPQTMAVTHPSPVPVGDARLAVTAVGASSGLPVEGALVCLMKAGEVYATGLTASDGSVGIEISPATPTGELRLTVTASNMDAYTTVITVTTGEPFVQVASYACNGSEEGLVSPGVEVTMDACFKNYGSQAATGVSAVLHGWGEGVAMIDSFEVIGTLAPGDSALVPGAFRFSTGSGLENAKVLHLESEVTADGGKVWAGVVPVTCALPVLRYHHHTVMDVVSGDGDGSAEAGETVSLTVYAANDGLAAGEGVTATVSTGSPYLTFRSPALTYGDLPPGAGKNAHMEVLIDPSCPEPSFPVIRLQMSTEDGREFSDSLVLAVGVLGFFDDMEYVKGQWDTAGDPDLWHLSAHRAHSGTWSWYCGSEGVYKYGAGMDDTLAAAPATIGEDAWLSFWCWYECATYGNDGVFVEVNDGNGWATLDFLGSGGALAPLPVGNDWLEYTYDLSGYPPGTLVALRFRFVSDDDTALAEGVYIDDVRLGTATPDEAVGIEPPPAPLADALLQNYPNPFNPSTNLRFTLAQPKHIRLEIFDIRGACVRLLVDSRMPAGPNEILWDGRSDRGEPVSTGIYFCRLVTDGFSQTRKMVLLK